MSGEEPSENVTTISFLNDNQIKNLIYTVRGK